MRKTKTNTCALVFPVLTGLLLARIEPASAQQNAQTDAADFWINVGMGVSSLGFMAGSANGSLQSSIGIFSVRGAINSEELFDGDEFWDIVYGE